MPLTSPGWSKVNRQILERWLLEHHKNAAAVFDFDDTCIFNDISNAIFRHSLLDRRRLKLTREDILALVQSQYGPSSQGVRVPAII